MVFITGKIYLDSRFRNEITGFEKSMYVDNRFKRKKSRI